MLFSFPFVQFLYSPPPLLRSPAPEVGVARPARRPVGTVWAASSLSRPALASSAVRPPPLASSAQPATIHLPSRSARACRLQESWWPMDSKDSEVAVTLDGNKEDEEDDWEAMADRGEHDETLALANSLEQQAKVSPCSSSEKISTPSEGPKRRGRGSFLYDKSVLYSDQCGLEDDLNEVASNDQSGSKGLVDEQQKHKTNSAATRYGTKHVLVLYDFPPSTLAIDLEGFSTNLETMELPFVGLMTLLHLRFFGLHQMLTRHNLAYLQDIKCGH
ncbi:hypothetical protein GUJ93_ZPchr0001g32184 [Zizania palustris]|uniref:Uncharacterized protein n=1 Tax=Zizania palustris TaxID=103762 RepID=A0A8J5R8G8_ZIZPA|nr:hypothetical protein GUJ93_ZPchr0001g32184 [Zizania palustris]